MSLCVALEVLLQEIQDFDWKYQFSEQHLINRMVDFDDGLHTRLNPVQIMKFFHAEMNIVPEYKENIFLERLISRLCSYFHSYAFIYVFELMQLISDFSYESSDLLESPFDSIAIGVYKDDMVLDLSEHLSRVALLLDSN